MFKSEFNLIKGDTLVLKLIDTFPQKGEELPFYYWSIIVKTTHKEVGRISLRLGHNYHSYYNGNIGYEIDEKYRGNHYSYLACLMVIDVARKHNMDHLYLTCDFDNTPSYKTIKKLGASLVEEVVPPKDYLFYYDGIVKHRIYLLKI